MPDAPALAILDRARGCLLVGACGDALGAPVEFLRLAVIRARYGSRGIVDLDEAYGRVGAITDDTQMTMFTAEGLLRAWVRGAERPICHPPSVVHHAYLRWLLTQGERPRIEGDVPSRDGWLVAVEALWSRRAPGNTCLAALEAATALGEPARNSSKGCGGVMRVAPVGLIGREPFALASEIAALTHGHPTGSLAAGHLAATIHALVQGASLDDALDAADAALALHPDHEETAAAVAAARALAARGRRPEVPAELGQGWVAEEALAIAYWCARVADDPVDALVLAVNHDGDSDSTGSVAGQIVGTRYGPGFLPAGWLDRLELRAEIERLAADLVAVSRDEPPDAGALWEA